MHDIIRFAKNKTDFSKVLTNRVNEYFKTTNKSKKANAEMIIKTVAMFSFYFVPFAFIISGTVSSTPLFYALWMAMGVGMAGIGMSVMHDANHGAYSKKQWVNRLVGLSLSVVGASVFNWKIQHNLLHHTFTNIEGVDEDITPRGILRFSPNTKWKPICRYQHVYAWFLYSLLTFVWIFYKDFERMTKYGGNKSLRKENPMWQEWLALISVKAFYLFYILVLPIYLSSFSWGYVVLGILAMHATSGVILANVFQLAHAVDSAEYPEADKDGNMDREWAVHQMHTTVNYAQKKRLLSWYVGGLNFQIEHHLFSGICHVHYRNLEPIVRKTAHDFNLPYHAQETFFGALQSHYRLLKQVGQNKIPKLGDVSMASS